MGDSLRPKALRYIGCFFIVAPFFNLFLTYFLGNMSGYSWSSFQGFMAGIGWLEWLWLLLMATSGFLLLVSHKSALLLATITILIVVAINTSFFLEPEGSELIEMSRGIQIFFSVLLGVCAFVVLFYSRYPTFDYRQGWLKPRADRFDIRVPVRIVGDEVHIVETESLSLSGCRIRLDRAWGRSDRIRFVEIVFPDCEGIRIKAQVVGADQFVLRLKFRDFVLGQRNEFKDWVQSLEISQA